MKTPDLELILREGISAGQFGGSIESHGHHAMGFFHFSQADPVGGHLIDLGSGAGLPGLVLAGAFPDLVVTLVERRTGRAELLSRAVRRLGWVDRVTVLAADAADVGRGALRGSADWVTARLFGPPASTAELGAPLLKVGGSLITSEPRDGRLDDRWPADGLAKCGLEFAESWRTNHGQYLRFTRTETDVPDLPRPGARKRPLF